MHVYVLWSAGLLFLRSLCREDGQFLQTPWTKAYSTRVAPVQLSCTAFQGAPFFVTIGAEELTSFNPVIIFMIAYQD